MILDQIVLTKQREVIALRERLTRETAYENIAKMPKPLNFLEAITTCTHDVALIAEVKKASPSKGIIRADFDPASIGQEYAANGATCLSVLTDREYFQGAPEYVETAKRASGLPVLRKDFVIDELQVLEARLIGADAILLITAILEPVQLKALRVTAEEIGMTALVEVHDERELENALQSGAKLIGVNNRDWRDFSVDLATTERVAANIPSGITLVSESGIRTEADVLRVQQAGARAILVGETLMKASSIKSGIAQLFGLPT